MWPIRSRCGSRARLRRSGHSCRGRLLKPTSSRRCSGRRRYWETRDTLAARRKALADLKIPSTLVMREHVSFERPSFELRVRRVLGEGRAGVCRHAACRRHARSRDQPAGVGTVARRSEQPAGRGEGSPLGQIFGRGLVETSEDFGSRAHRPRIRSCSTGLRSSSPRNGVAGGAAPDDRSVGHLSPVVRCSSCLAERDPTTGCSLAVPASGSKRR